MNETEGLIPKEQWAQATARVHDIFLDMTSTNRDAEKVAEIKRILVLVTKSIVSSQQEVKATENNLLTDKLAKLSAEVEKEVEKRCSERQCEGANGTAADNC